MCGQLEWAHERSQESRVIRAYITHLERYSPVPQLPREGLRTLCRPCVAGLHSTYKKEGVFYFSDNAPKVNDSDRTAIDGNFDLIDKAAMEAIAPPNECPIGDRDPSDARHI
jgi:hypothetical protein